MNLSVLLDMAADTFGDRVLVGRRDGGLTAGALRERAGAVAATVQGVAAERLAFVGENDDLVPALLFGAALAGRPYVPVSYRLADDRLRAVLQRVAPALAVVDAGVVPRVGDVPGVAVRTGEELEAALAAGGGAGPAPAGSDAAAVWLFTSGTTGEPKAAVLRHDHLSAYVLATVEFASAGPDEAALVSVPPYHVAGIAAVVTGVYRGRRTVFLPSFDPRAWVDRARDEAVTHAMVVPTMLGRILDVLDADGGGLPALRHLSYGGGRMPEPVIERAMATLGGIDFVNAYGLTETSSTIAVLGPDEHRAAWSSDDPAARARLASVGRPLPTVEVEVRGPGGEPLPPGHPGEVWVRGEQVSGEYVGTGDVRVDGWFPTRDAGWLDDAGYLFLGGRLDDVIVRGGENISPGEIEDVLASHPGVADAAVVGVPDVEWGERVVAAVVPTGDPAPAEDELRAWVRARLRSSRTPEHVEVRAELPYNETGKLLRRVLRDELAERFSARG